MRRKDDSSWMMLALLLAPIAIFLYPVLLLVNFVIDNVGIFLIIAAIVIAVVVIVALIVSAADKKQKEEEAERQRQRAIEEEHRQNLKIIASVEQVPTLLLVPYASSFSNGEEEEVNRQFREFVKQKNEETKAVSHLDFLLEKEAALRALSRSSEADALQNEISVARNNVSKVRLVKIVYQSKNNTLMYSDPEIKRGYSAFVGILGSSKVPLLDEFIASSMVTVVPVSRGDALLFTPGYVLCYSASNQFFQVVPYKKVRISTEITTDLLEGYRDMNDEIESIRYLYETKDGSRDMRYSYANNPSYTYVYRGCATIKCGDVTYEKKFSNKSSTKEFEKSFKAYVTLLGDKYRKVVDQVLSDKKELISAGSVTSFLNQELEKAEKRKASEKARKEKKEQELKLLAERCALLSNLKALQGEVAPCWQFEAGSGLIEAQQLNELYVQFDMFRKKNFLATRCNQYITENQKRFCELNAALGLESGADLGEWAIQPIFKDDALLPTRFVTLNNHFSKFDCWQDFKKCAEKFVLKNSKENAYESFFSDIKYLPIQGASSSLLFFPYCMVLFDEKKPMVVLPYRDVSVKTRYRKEEIVSDKIPKNGELVQERYMHLNADGSINKRYKENPIVKTVRYTELTVQGSNFNFKFPANKYEKALLFASAFNSLVESFSKSPMCEIYNLICSSADVDAIVAEIENQKKAEKERIRQEKLRAEAEAKRLEELRKEEERAAEERRRTLVQRQKELNEERRRKLAEEEERKKRVESMFRDDFEKDGSSGKEPSVKIKTSEIEVPFEVIGKRMISNSVFKVTLRCLDSVPLGTVTASFVSLCGERISNLKQITLQAGEDVTLGFVLNPGREFTEMKGCYLRLESEGAVVGDFLFEMNISFSNDF